MSITFDERHRGVIKRAKNRPRFIRFFQVLLALSVMKTRTGKWVIFDGVVKIEENLVTLRP